MRWPRALLVALVVLLVLAGGAYYWLLIDSRIPADAAYSLDLDRVRAELAKVSSDKPSVVEVEQVAEFTFPAIGVVAGDSWQGTPLPVYSYRLVYPDGAIVVDTALEQAMGGSDLTSFDIEALGRVQAAMRTATQIVITHEHMDHIGGLTSHPDIKTVLQRARLTREQLADPQKSLPAKFPEHALDDYQPLEYEHYHAIAPGVVLIKAPGHTPGSQMVYVQTADGTEILLIGDVAWHFRNIQTQRERARLVTMLFLKEDRSAVFGQLAALKRLHETQPAVHIVPGHDGRVIEALLAAGVLKRGFSP